MKQPIRDGEDSMIMCQPMVMMSRSPLYWELTSTTGPGSMKRRTLVTGKSFLACFGIRARLCRFSFPGNGETEVYEGHSQSGEKGSRPGGRGAGVWGGWGWGSWKSMRFHLPGGTKSLLGSQVQAPAGTRI